MKRRGVTRKNDKINELFLLGKLQEERMIKQEKMLRELGIHLEDVSSHKQ